MSSPTVTNLTTEWLISCPPAMADYLESLLWTLDGLDTLEEVYAPESDDQTRLEHLTGIKVFSRQVDFEEDLQHLLATEEVLKANGCQILHRKEIADEDWAESWKQHWKPTRIHEQLLICPSWERLPTSNERLQETERVLTEAAGQDIVLRLDPGAAFGTGTHETTCLMLQGMYALSQTQDFAQWSVLDVGTGSGILAIYAAKLGSRSVMGVDNDSKAVSTARENAQINDTTFACTFSDTPLDELCLTQYDLVLANIIAPVILTLLPDMLARLSCGGRLMLSGLIEKSVGEVEATLQDVGLIQIQRRQLGDWFALDAVKPSIL